MEKEYKIALTVGVLVGAVLLLGLLVAPGSVKLGGGQPIFAGLNGTHASSTVTSTAKIILAKDSSAQIRCFTNTGSDPVTLGFGTSTGLALNSGYTLVSSSSKVFHGDDLYTGDIYAVSTVGGTKVAICEI